MRVLHVIDSEGFYGAEVMLLNLAVQQKEMGLHPIVLNMRRSGGLEATLENETLRNGVDFCTIHARTGPDISAGFRIIRYAKARRVDLIHSHGYKPNILIGFIPRKARRLPILTTIHGWTHTGGNAKMRLYEWLDACSLQSFDAIVLVTKAMLSHPRLRGRGHLNIHVVNNGIPISSKTAYDGITLGIQHLRPVDQRLDKSILAFCDQGYAVGAIGRLSTEKGFPRLVEAIGFVSLSHPEIRLVIIGEGEQRQALENKIKELRLADRVLLPGYRKEARAYITHFNLFALSSQTEGLPLTLLEAMQAGVPIVSTRVGGIPEALDQGKAGLLVDRSSTKELAQGICTLYNNPKLGEVLAEKARQIVSTRFSANRMTTEYIRLYNQISSSRS